MRASVVIFILAILARAAIALAPPLHSAPEGLAELNPSVVVDAPRSQSDPQFWAIDVYLDSAGKPLAAYQFELECQGEVELVGVEGGEHPAFRTPPYYDPAANLNRRIVIAAYTLSSDLPRCPTRVARLMVAAHGAPVCAARLQVAADGDGRQIDARISTMNAAPGNGD